MPVEGVPWSHWDELWPAKGGAEGTDGRALTLMRWPSRRRSARNVSSDPCRAEEKTPRCVSWVHTLMCAMAKSLPWRKGLTSSETRSTSVKLTRETDESASSRSEVTLS